MHATASTHPYNPCALAAICNHLGRFRGPLLMALLAMIASFALLFTVPMITRSMLDRFDR